MKVPPVHHTIIAVDVAGSASRPSALTLQLREDLRNIVIEVLGNQSISWDSVHHDDLGDGLRILLGPEYPASAVLGRFITDLDMALRAHRLRASDTARLRLRMAVHQGLAHYDGGVWAGKSLERTARLLDSEPLRRALRDEAVNLAVIVSDDIYREVIQNELGPPVRMFRSVNVIVKETRTQAWLYVPPTSRRTVPRIGIAAAFVGVVVLGGLLWWLQPWSAHSINPQASVSPPSGGHETLFMGSASGFTPNGSVLISATRPDGSAYPTTFPKTADASGAFSWSWKWEPGDPDGLWTITLLDQESGRSSMVTLTITGTTVDPSASVSPSSGDHETLFVGSASGFTPNGSVLISATRPDGSAYPTTFPKTADASGAFSWSWKWEPGDPDGLWTITLLDQESGRSSTVTLTITDAS